MPSDSKLEVSQDALPARPRGQVSTLSPAYRFVVNAIRHQINWQQLLTKIRMLAQAMSHVRDPIPGTSSAKRRCRKRHLLAARSKESAAERSRLAAVLNCSDVEKVGP